MAHGILLNAHQSLAAAGRALPAAAAHMLMLLHSYLLVRLLVRMGDHLVRLLVFCNSADLGWAPTRQVRRELGLTPTPWHTQGAARMLLRVTSHIELFSKHKVAILTSAVIECQRGGLPRRAHGLALLLMQPENQAQVQPQYRRKLAAMLERSPPNRSEETAGFQDSQNACGSHVMSVT